MPAILSQKFPPKKLAIVKPGGRMVLTRRPGTFVRPPAEFTMVYWLTNEKLFQFAVTVPRIRAFPLTLANVDVVPLAFTRKLLPAAVVRLPFTFVDVPGALGVPGVNVPPPETVVLPTVPAPVSPAPLFTVTGDDAIEPSTDSTPAFRLVAPV